MTSGEFGEPNASPLLGATMLELSDLAVDPVNKRLLPVAGVLKICVPSRSSWM
ncbi:MAG: hypothetical protein KGJ59_10530 [Bacteroidota bacterium]|nr:hypothetical protein [Bacteroidota bacterium]